MFIIGLPNKRTHDVFCFRVRIWSRHKGAWNVLPFLQLQYLNCNHQINSKRTWIWWWILWFSLKFNLLIDRSIGWPTANSAPKQRQQSSWLLTTSCVLSQLALNFQCSNLYPAHIWATFSTGPYMTLKNSIIHYL